MVAGPRPGMSRHPLFEEDKGRHSPRSITAALPGLGGGTEATKDLPSDVHGYHAVELSLDLSAAGTWAETLGEDDAAGIRHCVSQGDFAGAEGQRGGEQHQRLYAVRGRPATVSSGGRTGGRAIVYDMDI